MPDVRLHRANSAKLLVRSLWTRQGQALSATRDLSHSPTGFKGTRQPGDFDGISQNGSVAVRLYVTDRPGIYSSFLEGPFDDFSLCLRIGYSVPIGLAPVIDCCRLDHPINMIPVDLCLSQWFE